MYREGRIKGEKKGRGRWIEKELYSKRIRRNERKEGERRRKKKKK